MNKQIKDFKKVEKTKKNIKIDIICYKVQYSYIFCIIFYCKH